MSSRDVKGYALAAGDRPPGRLVESLDGFSWPFLQGGGLRYRHLEGRWYLCRYGGRALWTP
jgi:hypothetical protein